MEIELKEKEKRVYIWLTHTESEDGEFVDSLRPLFRAYKEKKYLVTVFHSGTEDLRELTREWLLYNKTRLREIEIKNEQSAACT